MCFLTHYLVAFSTSANGSELCYFLRNERQTLQQLAIILVYCNSKDLLSLATRSALSFDTTAECVDIVNIHHVKGNTQSPDGVMPTIGCLATQK